MTFDLTRIDIESIKQELPLKKKELDSKFNVHDFVVLTKHITFYGLVIREYGSDKSEKASLNYW
jgi:hypothetical protein